MGSSSRSALRVPWGREEVCQTGFLNATCVLDMVLDPPGSSRQVLALRQWLRVFGV